MAVVINGTTGIKTSAITTDTSVANTSSTLTGESLSRIKVYTAKATTSGTTVDFSPTDGTGIPSWAKRVTVMLVGVSCAGGGYVGVQLGTGTTPTYTTSGYSGCAWQNANFTNFTNIIVGSSHNSAGDIRLGSITLTKQSGNTWVSTSIVSTSNAASVGGGAFSTTLSDVLTAVRLTTHSGDTFDAGSVNILVEG